LSTELRTRQPVLPSPGQCLRRWLMHNLSREGAIALSRHIGSCDPCMPLSCTARGRSGCALALRSHCGSCDPCSLCLAPHACMQALRRRALWAAGAGAERGGRAGAEQPARQRQRRAPAPPAAARPGAHERARAGAARRVRRRPGWLFTCATGCLHVGVWWGASSVARCFARQAIMHAPPGVLFAWPCSSA